QEEAEQPHCPVTENIAAKEQASINDQQSALPEDRDEKGKADDSPSQSRKEARELSAAAQAVNGDGAALDPRHDPGDEEDRDQGNGLADERCLDGYFGLRGLWSMRIDLVGDEACGEKKGCEETDEDEQSPAGAESVPPNENLVERRRRNGCAGLGRDQRWIGIQRWVGIQWASSCFANRLRFSAFQRIAA